MREVMKQIEKVNGSGWLIGLIVNVIWTTMAIAGLYWVLHEDVAVLKVRQVLMLEELRDMKGSSATKQEVAALTKLTELERARIWDAVNRKQDRQRSGQ